MSLIEERRQWEEGALKASVPGRIDCVTEQVGGVSCLIISVKNALKDRVVLYLHGGGLISGSAVTHRSLAAMLTEYLQIPFLLADYRLLPEHPYPAPLDDALAVYLHLIQEQGFTPNNVVVAGDSSGAGLALAMLVKLRELEIALPAKVFMLCGAFDATLSGASMMSNDGKDPMLSHRELTEWRDNYMTNPGSPLLSPLFSSLHGLPPMLLLAGGKDLWLSDSERVATKIKQCGGEVELQVYESVGHLWMMDAGLKDTQDAMFDIARFMDVGS